VLVNDWFVCLSTIKGQGKVIRSSFPRTPMGAVPPLASKSIRTYREVVDVRKCKYFLALPIEQAYRLCKDSPVVAEQMRL
jgi:hypothetical protein